MRLDHISDDDLEEAVAVVVIKRNEALGGWEVHAEGDAQLSRLQLASILGRYAQRVTLEERARAEN